MIDACRTGTEAVSERAVNSSVVTSLGPGLSEVAPSRVTRSRLTGTSGSVSIAFASPEKTYPLGMVLSACPDIVDYAKGGIGNWRDFLATAAVVRTMLGISPRAWEEGGTGLGGRPWWWLACCSEVLRFNRQGAICAN